MICQVGLEVLLDNPDRLPGERFGLLVNQASIDEEFRYSHELLHARFPGQLAAIFTPQHGMFSEQQDNMIESPHGWDEVTEVPVHSLYADRRRPTKDMLEGLGCFVVDLQDVGTRVYTYIWTLSLCLEACAEAGVPVLVLDRPNPLGDAVEGPCLEPGFESFVGRASIPMRHGLTIGEIAALLNEEQEIRAELSVVPVSGYRRAMLWSDTGRTWVPTSPNLPRFEGVLVYPGQVLLEGTNISEGRGTTTPFEVLGAPWIDPMRLLRHLTAVEFEGLILRPIRFEPTFQKHHGESCGGVYVHPTDPTGLRSYRFTVAVLAALHDLWPDQFRWNDPPYEYEESHAPIDILSGSSRLRMAAEAGLTAEMLEELTSVDLDSWQRRTAPHRIYD